MNFCFQAEDGIRDGHVTGFRRVLFRSFRDGVFRVRVAPNGTFPKDFSWAVIESPDAPAVKFEENQKEIRIAAGSVEIGRASCREREWIGGVEGSWRKNGEGTYRRTGTK